MRIADGQSTLSADGWFTAVSFTGTTWSFAVPTKYGRASAQKREGFRSADEAKLAAFDEITMRQNQRALALKATTPNIDGN